MLGKVLKKSLGLSKMLMSIKSILFLQQEKENRLFGCEGPKENSVQSFSGSTPTRGTV